MSYLQYADINSAPRIGKFINKLELYNQCPPRRVKDTNMSEIENFLCVKHVINVTPSLHIEREPWGFISILIKVNDGVYICSCSIKPEEYRCKTKHAFIYDSHFKPFNQSKCCGYIVDNREDTPICIM